MRTIKQAIIILLVLLIAGHIGSYFYFGSSERKVPPKITCPQEILEVSASDSESALLAGVTAVDEQDGDLTDKITISGISKLITNNTAKVTYIVFDSNDNMASCVREIRYTDYHRPTFAITEPLVYSVTEEPALLARLKATDVVDGDISKNIRVSTLEPSDNSDVFHVSIQASNSVGDTAWLRLPVLMLQSNPLRPEITLSQSLIYIEKNTKFTPSAYLQDLQVPGMDPSMADVVIDNRVDTGKTGTYYVTYSYTANGSTGTAILTVVVQ
jgi:hypothetical protein